MTWGRLAASAGLVATAAAAILGILASAANGWPTGVSPFIYGGLGLVFAGVGWLIVDRRDGNPVGAILLAFGIGLALYIPGDLYIRAPEPPPGAGLLALTIQALDVPSFTLLAVAVLLFPDGRLPSERWRPLLWIAALLIVASIVGLALDDAPIAMFPSFRSPIAITGFPGKGLVYAAYSGMLVLLLAACASLVVRWRRGNVLERAQVKWIAAASVAALAVELVNVATFDPNDPNGPIAIAATVALALIPIAIGIAILRYRLYEIDRIISRTIAYAGLTAVLGAVFAATILLLQAALQPFTQGQTVAVAASTLAVFALFQPIRRRVQAVVDRRFDRARYDAERTSVAFAERLRQEVDIDAVTADLRDTVRSAIKPAGLGLWLRGGGR